ncbi:hypothetical protein BJ741DRAFT_635115 [Chytriomyces cf. hyalinus JEL632]|nr:hypothetical protein BJ741DRAFT_635115 [Chytriomyces cf. hyalinus JEL632]
MQLIGVLAAALALIQATAMASNSSPASNAYPDHIGVHRAGAERQHMSAIGTDGQMYIPVWKASDAVYSRQEVHDFFAPKNIRAYSLFLQAFYYMKTLPETDPRSFAAIANIHGEPEGLTYDNFPGPKGDSNKGYCKHADPLFPLWHRPYIALIETVIVEIATTVIAPTYTQNTTQWVALAKTIRFPYWDYASDAALKDPYPAIFSQPSVVILVGPSGAQFTMENPLVSFSLPEDIYDEMQSSGMRSQDTYRTGALSTHEVAQTRAQVRLLFDTTLEDWFAFSNTQMDSGDSQNPRQFHSIEGIHNNIHGYVGSGSYMGNPASASYDPIFYFHHCNIDRLTALYQACFNEFPDPSIANTPLTPFRIRPGSNDAWTSYDSNSTRAFGYTYPELANGTRGTQLARSLYQTYTFVDPAGIVDTNPNGRRRDSVKRRDISTRDVGGSPTMYQKATRYLEKGLAKAYSLAGFRHSIEATTFTENKPTTPAGTDAAAFGGEAAYAHYSVDMHSIDEPFTVVFKVDGYTAGSSYVFATRKNHHNDVMVIGSSVVLTFELYQAGLLHKPEEWKKHVTVELRDFVGDTVDLKRFPTLNVILRGCLHDAEDKDNNPYTKWSEDAIQLYP